VRRLPWPLHSVSHHGCLFQFGHISGNRIGGAAVYEDDVPSRVVDTLPEEDKLAWFEKAVLPHLDAAYNLARWLTGRKHDAEDVVQEAYLRAFQFFGGFHGVDGRSWLLTIVRNTCYTWLEHNRGRQPVTSFDEEKHSGALPGTSPEGLLLRKEEQQLLRAALEELAPEFREVIVLREFEGLSYQEIAGIAGIPLGTVMSRLARAREKLHESLGGRREQGIAT
jgi:RNA polymerase sigma factor (sigma-70 family)